MSPIHESGGKQRDRWPLAMDLEGIPRNTAERTRLLEQQRLSEEELPDMAVPMRGLTQPVPNQFAGSAPQETVVDINNPPHRNYNPYDPKNEFPRMLYNHDTGKVLTVNSAKKEQIATTKHGFQREPAPDRNYHGARSGMMAPVKAVLEPREDELIAADLAEEEEGEEVSVSAGSKKKK